MSKSGSSSPDVIPVWGVVLCLSLLVLGVASHDLWTPDEPREAEIARAMSDGGSWLIPHLAGAPFVEKPPLYYWISASMMRLFGSWVDLTVVARATSALFSMLTLIVVWLVVREYLGPRRGLITVLVLVTTVGFFDVNHWVMIDGLLMLLVTAAVLLLFVGLDQSRSSLLLLGYLAVGLAFLAKGFVAWAVIAPPGLALLILYFRTILRHPLRHASGLVMMVGPALVWMLAFRIYGDPNLFREWFFDNQLGRFMGTTQYLGHINGPFYYLGLAPLILLPWTLVLAGWIVQRGWREWSREPGGARNLLRISAAWSFGSLLLLSLAQTKRGIYLYPLLPGFAVIVACAALQMPRWVQRLFWVLFAASILVMMFIALVTPVWVWADQSLKFELDFKPLVLFILAASVFTLVAYRKSPFGQVVFQSALCYLTAIFVVFPILNRYKSYVPTVHRITESIPSSERSRVCGWGLGETEKAIFDFYSGMTINNLTSRKQLDRVLKGEDDLCSMVVTKKDRWPGQDADLPPWKVLAKNTMEVNRTLLLIRGDNEAGETP